ncbi:hypothetical protein [Lysinibacillus sp. TE18511]
MKKIRDLLTFNGSSPKVVSDINECHLYKLIFVPTGRPQESA